MFDALPQMPEMPADPPVAPPAGPPAAPGDGRQLPRRPKLDWNRPPRTGRRAAVPVRAATLAAAAALGAFVGFGLRSGASLGRLGVVTLRLRGLPEFVSPDRGAVGAALLGGLHVALVAGVWGAAVGAVTRVVAERGLGVAWRITLGVLLMTGFAALDAALPAAIRLGAGSVTWGERALVGMLAACAGVGAAQLAGRPSRAR